jgi:hypothetical protein
MMVASHYLLGSEDGEPPSVASFRQILNFEIGSGPAQGSRMRRLGRGHYFRPSRAARVFTRSVVHSDDDSTLWTQWAGWGRLRSSYECHPDDASEGELRKWLLASGQPRATRSRFRSWIARRGPPYRLQHSAPVPDYAMLAVTKGVARRGKDAFYADGPLQLNKPWVPPAKEV